MEFLIKSGQPHKQRTPCLILGIFAGKKLSSAARIVDEASKGTLSRILRRGDIDGQIGESLIIYDIPGCLADRVLLIGCGKERNLTEQNYIRIHQHLSQVLAKSGITAAVSYLTQLSIKKRDTYWTTRFAIETLEQEQYTFTPYKKEQTKLKCKHLVLITPSRAELSQAELALQHAQAISSAKTLARNLGNTPPNDCRPKDLVYSAQKLTETFKSLSCEVLDEAKLEQEGLHSLLAVGRGSIEPSYLIQLSYHGARNTKDAPIVFVGKGVTFDTGGLDLKSPANMIDMKTDMCGAAAVLALMHAIAELALPINVIGLVPTVENAISGNAYRPSDIVKTLSGQTVEVRNTDAEGRLILCDALTYAERFNPDTVIDIATLTGAIVVALGHQYTGLFGTHSPLNHEILKAGQDAMDEAWLMPMTQEGYDAIKSPIADLQNIGRTGPAGGSIIAACFLSKFTEKYRWAHLDIAGVARTEKSGVTGRAVPQLVQFLLNRVGH